MADKEYNGFIWDENKNKANVRNHGLSFETACHVFEDPRLLIKYDAKNSTETEDRYNCIGLIHGVLVTFVSTTEREGKTRIISARKATKTEVREYESHSENL